MTTTPSTPPSPDDPLRGLSPAELLAAGLATVPAAADAGPPPPEPAALAPEFPSLEILELLGRGGMGAVYKARQRDLARLVALKILRPGLDADPDFADRFGREARALAGLNHPGIVTLYEFGRTSAGRYFILMEFVEGVNLRQLLAAGRLAPREALAIVPPLCDALQYAHDRGLVHRDIKPENILVDRLGRVKIADFGIAKLASATAAAASQTNGAPDPGGGADAGVPVDATLAGGKVVGTPAYMAPEQLAHPAQVDHRADLYALGVVFYQMLTGELPAPGQLEPPSTRVALDVRLDAVVLRALERSPERRYGAASEMKTDLEALKSQPAPEPAGQPMRRGVALRTKAVGLMVCAALVALVTLVVGWYWLNDAPSDEGAARLALVPPPAGEAGEFEFTPEREVVLGRGRPGGLRFSDGRFVAFEPTGGMTAPDMAPEWVDHRGVDAFSSADSHRPGIMFVGTNVAVLPDGAWNGAAGALAHFGKEAATEGLFTFIEAPGWGAPPKTVVQRTKNAGVVLAQIAAAGDDGSIRLRYKRVVRATGEAPEPLVTPSSPGLSGDLAALPVRLEALAWYRESVLGEPEAPEVAWGADGARLAEPARLPVPPGVTVEGRGGDEERLVLWFSHPGIDELSDGWAVVSVVADDDTGAPLSPSGRRFAQRTIAPGTLPARDAGWLIATLTAGTAEALPERARVRVVVGVGGWTKAADIRADWIGFRALGTGWQLIPAQNADGRSVVTVVRDLEVEREHAVAPQAFAMLAVTHDGRRVASEGRSASSSERVRTEYFYFNQPLSRLRGFEFFVRPMVEASWVVPLRPRRDEGPEG